MRKLFDLEIITPERMVFKGAVRHVQAPGVGGSFGILYNHTPFLTMLKVGCIEIDTEEGVKWYATSGGFAEVMDNKMSILVETAEESGNIDVDRARQSRDRALKRLQEIKAEKIDVARAQASLARALNRLTVAEHTSRS